MRPVIDCPQNVSEWIAAVTEYARITAHMRRPKNADGSSNWATDVDDKAILESVNKLYQLEAKGAGEQTRDWLSSNRLMFLNWVPCSLKELGIRPTEITCDG